MKRLILLIAASLLIFACSESDDGPMSIYPDNFAVGGYGYMLYAELDSGYRFHIQGDSLTLAMDSMWTFGNCFLKDIELYTSYSNDTVLTITVKLALGNTGKTDCPQPLFRPDTVLRLPFMDDWKEKGVREIRVEGSAHNDFYSEDPDTAEAANSLFKDSILIRKGKFRAESISVYLDSAFADPYTYPRRTENDTVGVLFVTDSLKVDTFPYRFMKSRCIEIHDSCETVPDTAWRSTWSAKDTNLVPIRAVCAADTAADSLVYCLSSNWKNDSTALSDSTYDYLDTTWYNSKYFMEKIPKCAGVDHGDFSGSAVYGRYFTTKHVLFVPASGEKGCGPAALSKWIVYSLSAQKEVLDSVWADSLLTAWKKASVGAVEEEDDE
ncbi:MAG: hypothetical protein J6Z31_00545 [Fibrobacter sp.]|nr:hypothetical protein [Fibrobacter sp.]